MRILALCILGLLSQNLFASECTVSGDNTFDVIINGNPKQYELTEDDYYALELKKYVIKGDYAKYRVSFSAVCGGGYLAPVTCTTTVTLTKNGIAVEQQKTTQSSSSSIPVNIGKAIEKMDVCR